MLSLLTCDMSRERGALSLVPSLVPLPSKIEIIHQTQLEVKASPEWGQMAAGVFPFYAEL